MDRQDPRHPFNILARLLQRRPRQEAAPALPPRPDIDREEERRRAAPRRAPAPHVAAPFYTGQKIEPGRAPPATPREAFDRHSMAADIRARQEFDRRFKSDKARELAQKAIDEAAELRDQNQQRFNRAIDDINERLYRLTLTSLPVPAEAGRHVNQQIVDAAASRDREELEIAQYLEQGLSQAATLDLEAPETIIPEERRLGYSPDRTGTFRRAAVDQDEPAPPTQPEPTDWVAHFQRAGGQAHPTPGRDIDR